MNNFDTVRIVAQDLHPIYMELMNRIHQGVMVHGMGQFGILSLDYLRKRGYPIKALVDSDSAKSGMLVDGMKVVGPDRYAEMSSDGGVILVAARHKSREIIASLQYGLPAMSFEAFFVLENMGRYERLRNSVFTDVRSREVLDALMLAALTGDSEHYARVCEDNQYFCLSNFSYGANEVLINAGAYVGDTIEDFIWSHKGQFKKIFAFEPATRQFNAMQKRTARLIEEWALGPGQIELIQGGVSSYSGEVEAFDYDCPEPTQFSFATMNMRESSSKGTDITMSVHKLDDFFEKTPFSMLIADIEGLEQQLLEGARESIRRNRPKMCLCVYHKMPDLFDFIDFLSELNIGYRYALRHHTPTACETVLYCY